jgi:hypothetical protein
MVWCWYYSQGITCSVFFFFYFSDVHSLIMCPPPYICVCTLGMCVFFFKNLADVVASVLNSTNLNVYPYSSIMLLVKMI